MSMAKDNHDAIIELTRILIEYMECTDKQIDTLTELAEDINNRLIKLKKGS